jgi:hypothetical protein
MRIHVLAITSFIAVLPALAGRQTVPVVDHRRTAAPEAHWTVGAPCTSVGATSDSLPDGLYRTTGATRLGDGTVVVATNVDVSLLFFDQRGNLVARAGGRGGGPGEFDGPAVFVYRYRGDSVIAHSVGRAAQQFSVFGPNGRFARSFRLAPRSSANPGLLVGTMFGDGSLVTRVSPGSVALRPGDPELVRPESAVVRIYDALGAEKWTSRPLPDVVTARGAPEVQRGSGGRVAVRLGSRAPGRVTRWNGIGSTTVAVGTNVLYHFEESSDALVVYGPDGTERRRVLLRPLPDSLRPGRGRTFEIAAAQVLEVLADRAGRAWVEVARPTLETDRRWWVFDEAGRWIAEAITPAGPRMLELGADYVLFLKRDADELERVESCPVVRRG